ncbi:MAG TPA: type II toxin-antitoxin system VapC family toxin [Candidatus Hydrogenedentes bacterium]|nr:type II toxin-antitoxin system VapC family toxin [Candidatus Hydrogenedentota bacterium]HIJ73944.1 type II toxin-antitoxin system VapC family toxin [Candidatus Hydrogenedentota bacterium]
MKGRLYIETSVVSYLTSRLSRDLVIVARQELTRETWAALLSEFEVYVSALVVQEVGQGDDQASASRLKAVDGIPVLDLTDSVKVLAGKLIEEGAIPDTHLEDALHVAVAAANGMDFLLTWNFTHINNAFTRSRIRDVIEAEGYGCPELCSPEELFGEEE